MEKKIEQLQKKLQISEHQLEIALKEHPDLVYEIGQEYALAISKRDEAKFYVDEIEAKVAIELRDDAARVDEKITDKTVESRTRLDRRVIGQTKVYHEAKLQAAQWSVLKEACDQRSYALSKLVDLYIANYYSEIEKKGDTDFKTVRAQRVKEELAERRRRVEL